MAFKSEAKRKAYLQAWYQKNRKRLLKERKAYREANRKAVRARQREWDKRNRHRKAAKTYNISHDCAKQLLALKRCQICKRPAAAIDHDHRTNRVRGRLCNSCNNGLGRFRDNPKLLRAAADYLEEGKRVCV